MEFNGWVWFQMPVLRNSEVSATQGVRFVSQITQISPFLKETSRIEGGPQIKVPLYLHFVNNRQLPANGAPGYHCLQRVKSVIDTLCSRCLAVYHPSANISVDETMYPFKGKPCVLMIIHIHLHCKIYTSK